MKNCICRYSDLADYLCARIHSTLCLLLALTMGTMLQSCHKNEPIEPKARKTIIVYMCAENTLSRYTNPDISEMLSVANTIPDDCNLVVYVDDANYPYLQIITNDNPEHKESMIERNSADPEVFIEILTDIKSRYPAETYSLVMWSHANGWLPADKTTKRRSFGVDNGRNDSHLNEGSEMNIWDMREALQYAGMHFDFILFDACFMQSIESTYELRSVADYIIASPAEIPGNGAPYDKIMAGLTGNGEEAVKQIIDNYYKYYSRMDNTTDGNTGIVISAYKTSEMENLLKLTRELLPDLYSGTLNISTDNVQKYGAYPYTNLYDYYDMGSLMGKILTGPEYQRWRSQLDRTAIFRYFTNRWTTIYNMYDVVVLPKVYDQDNISLCTIFLPEEKYDTTTNYNETIKLTQWYQDFTK